MAITVDWASRVINVPQADLLSLGGGIYELDLDAFRLTLKALESSVDGMAFPDTHFHNPPVTVAGVTIARVVVLINGYTVTFEDGQYAVNLKGANSNVADVTNVNQVSTRSFNTAGLIEVITGSTLTPTEALQLLELYQLAGLDKTDPITKKPSQFRTSSGDIVIDVTGDGENTSTGTRQ